MLGPFPSNQSLLGIVGAHTALAPLYLGASLGNPVMLSIVSGWLSVFCSVFTGSRGQEQQPL